MSRGLQNDLWRAELRDIPSGQRFRLLQDDSPISFREMLGLFENNGDFIRWYSETLAGCPFRAFFWELPPLTESTLDDQAEFVVLDSAALADTSADPGPFNSQFARKPQADVITFPNLGGDALLIVPAPIAAIDVYAHLATFLRRAPRSQVQSLWKTTARLVCESLSESPMWLSTAGLGVYWLHLRLDTYPKYYRHQPYETNVRNRGQT